MKSTYTLVSGVIFGVVAAIQAIRAIAQWPVQIGAFSVPLWFSWGAAIAAGGLCVWAFKSRQE